MAKAKNKTGLLRARCAELLQQQLEQAAKKEDVKPAVLIRRFITGGLNGDIQVQDYTPLVDALHDLGGNLARVGGNLNQLAFYFNTKDEVDENQLSLVHGALINQFSEVAQLLKKIKNELV